MAVVYLTFDYINGKPQIITPPTVSAGADDAGKIFATASNGQFDPSLIPGSSTSFIVFENLTAGQLVNIFSNSGAWNVRKADAASGKEAHGFVLSSVTANGSNTIIVYFRDDNTSLSSLTPGNYFLGLAGAITNNVSTYTTPGYIIQKVGVSSNATTLKFQCGPVFERA